MTAAVYRTEMRRALDMIAWSETLSAVELAAQSKVNEPLLREVLGYIELHPESWHQGSWWQEGVAYCGTIGCFAGWTVALGHQEFGLDNLHLFHGAAVDIEYTAQRLLDLTREQAARLFYFTSVVDSKGYPRHPTFGEFCGQVELVTGVRFKPAPAVCDGP